jgi:iron complex outermembrane receptor protein
LANTITNIRGPAAQAAVCTDTVTTGTCAQQLVTTPVGYPAYSLYPYLNAGIDKTSGIDIDLRSFFDAGDIGGFTAELNVTHMIQYEFEVEGITYDVAGTHGPSGISGDTGNPKERATASLTWNRGPATMTVLVNYTGAFSITDPSAGYNTCLQSIESGAPSAYGSAINGAAVTTLPSAWYQYCSVHHFTDVNLHAAYKATDHLEVHGSITNLFNVVPPVDLQTYGGGGELRYDAALHQDGAVGRFYLLGATFKF